MAENLKLPEFPYADSAEVIRTRMLEKVSDEWDKAEGGFIFDALSPGAVEMQLAYERARDLLKWGFAVTTFGQYLDMKAAERGLSRRQAVPAVGTLVVSGETGTVIPAGSVFSTEVDQGSESEPIMFAATEEATIGSGGVATLPVAAVKPGVAGNIPAGSIKVVVSKITGIDSVTNPAPTTQGTDIESDERMLARYLDLVRNPGASGNVADYVKWAREADPLVGKVRVLPLAAGPGTVKVIITDINDRPAAPDLITRVQQYIDPAPGMGEGASPIGATVTVATPATVAIHLKLKLTVIRGYDAETVRADVRKAVENYLGALVLNSTDNDVRFSKIGSVIGAVDGVQDYEQLALRTDTTSWAPANILIGDAEMAIMGDVTWL